MGYSVQSIGNYTTYLPTYTGCSVDPTVGEARYTLTGKMCTVTVRNSSSGTSNNTTKTITLPFAAANTGTQLGYILCTDNGTNRHGIIRTQVNSNVANLFLTNSTGVSVSAWTNSGTWSCQFTFTYEIA